MKKMFIGILLSLMLTFFVSSQALASGSSALATADLTWSLVTNPSNINWTTVPFNIYTAVATDTVYGTDPGTPGINSETASLPNASATAQATAGSVSTSSYVGPAAVYINPTTGFTEALSRVDVYGTFSVTSSGVVKFTIPWNVAYKLITDTGANSYSYGIASVYMDLIKTTNGKEAERTHYEFVSNTNEHTGLLNDSASGTYTLGSGMNFAVGDTGLLQLTAYSQVDAASAAVPIPAGLWLLGSGLLGLVGIRRKSIKA